MSIEANSTLSALKQALEALEDWNAPAEYMDGVRPDEEIIASLRTAIASYSQAIAEAEDNYHGSDAAKAAHMMDLYTALGVKWGEDPFAVIAKMRSIAGAEKQERPTGPATSADRYFYEAGFEAGRQQGMKQEQRSDSEHTGEPVALKVYHGELCYKSQADDQSLGMWCPVTQDLPFPEGTKFYTTPQQRTWVGLTGEEIETQAKKDNHSFYFALGALWAEDKLKAKNFAKEKNTCQYPNCNYPCMNLPDCSDGIKWSDYESDGRIIKIKKYPEKDKT